MIGVSKIRLMLESVQQISTIARLLWIAGASIVRGC